MPEQESQFQLFADDERVYPVRPECLDLMERVARLQARSATVSAEAKAELKRVYKLEGDELSDEVGRKEYYAQMAALLFVGADVEGREGQVSSGAVERGLALFFAESRGQSAEQRALSDAFRRYLTHQETGGQTTKKT